MNFTGSDLMTVTWFGFTAWRLCAAAALLLSFLIYKFYGHRPSRDVANKSKIRATSQELVYTNAPTVRLTDTQRMDRLHRVVSLKVGEEADLHDITFGRVREFRVALRSIEQESGQDFAQINIALGGEAARGGDSVKELRANSFLVPRTTLDDQRCSIQYFCGRADAVSFLQVKVKQINAVDRTAVLDVLHVRGRWAT